MYAIVHTQVNLHIPSPDECYRYRIFGLATLRPYLVRTRGESWPSVSVFDFVMVATGFVFVRISTSFSEMFS